jgi:hypothetical protein
MAVEDVVAILTDYYQSGEEAFGERHGGEALIVVRDILDLLETELEEELQYDALWEAFEADPRGTAVDLSGRLEALVEADPGLAEQLDLLVGEYHAAGRAAAEAEGADRQAPTVAAPVAPDSPAKREIEPEDHRNDAGEGTYLYGNVKAGDTTVGEALEMGSGVLDVQQNVEALSFEVEGLFDQLYATLERRTELASEIKVDLQDELQNLEAELALGEDASEGCLLRCLRNIGQLDLDFLELVLTGLGNTRTEARFVVQNAIRRMREEG